MARSHRIRVFYLMLFKGEVQRRNTETISKIFPDVSTGKGYFTGKKKKKKQWIKNS